MGLFLFGVPRMRDSNPTGCGAEETRSVFQRGPQGAKRRSGCGFAKRMRRHPAGGTIRISKPGTFVVTGFFPPRAGIRTRQLAIHFNVSYCCFYTRFCTLSPSRARAPYIFCVYARRKIPSSTDSANEVRVEVPGKAQEALRAKNEQGSSMHTVHRRKICTARPSDNA